MSFFVPHSVADNIIIAIRRFHLFFLAPALAQPECARGAKDIPKSTAALPLANMILIATLRFHLLSYINRR